MSKCAESKLVEPLICGEMVIGHYDDLNGKDAELVQFTPTKAELKTLAYHYLDRFFAVQSIYAQGQSGSWEWREEQFAWARFTAIAEMLNPDGIVEKFQTYINEGWAHVAELGAEVERDNSEDSEE